MKTNILKWAVLAACLHGTVATAQDFDEVHVWHALNGSAEQVFVETADAYQGETGTSVVVSQFNSQQDLYVALQVAQAAGQQLPDVLLGNHTMVLGLVEGGLLTAYCLPEQCPECESANPPRWCSYASNGYYGDYYGGFEATMIPELQMTADRCLEDGCGECDRTDIVRPPYCDYVMSLGGAQLDVLQAGFAWWHPGYQLPFPLGIPVWWEYFGVAANLPRLQEQYGLELPTDISQAQEVLSFNNALFMEGFDGEFCGTPPRRFKVPGWTDVGGSSPDPIPALDADLFLVPSSRLASLLQEVPGLEVATLAGDRPQIIVDGAFVLATTQNRSAALDFMYELGSPAFQAAGIDGTSILPAHGEAFGVTDNTVPGLREAGLTGRLSPTYR